MILLLHYNIPKTTHPKPISIISKASRIVKKEVFQMKQQFDRSFSKDCQEESVSQPLLLLTNLIIAVSGIQLHIRRQDFAAENL